MSKMTQPSHLRCAESAAAALNGGYDLTSLVGVALSLIAMAVALYVLRCGRALETEREPVGAWRPPAYREGLMKQ